MKEGISVLVVDDEPLNCGRLKRLLASDPDIGEVMVCTTGKEAVDFLMKQDMDLVFLDIQMPGMNGFEVLKSMDLEDHPFVIFVTGYDQYAMQAFEVNALDYLLKPFSRARFSTSLQRAKDAIRAQRGQQELKHLLELVKGSLHPNDYWERVAVRMKEEVILLKVERIDWIEARGRYVTLHAGRESYLFREGIQVLETHLNPTRFARIHRSAIVNLDRVQKLQPWFHGEYRVLLYDGTALTLSRTYKPKLKQHFGD